MRIRARAVGTPIVYMTTAIMVGIIGWLALIAFNHGSFPLNLGTVALMVFGPSLVGVAMATRYWHESEFNRRMLTFLPLLLIALLVVVLALSSLLIVHPATASGQGSPPLPRKVPPSALPALPPVRSLQASVYSDRSSRLVGGGNSAEAELMRGMGSADREWAGEAV